VISSDGECTDSTGIPVSRAHRRNAETSWLTASDHTITSTPS
jgi:hypothetical protein